MKCPSCKIELTKLAMDEVEIDECRQCKGIWFGDDELRIAKDAMDGDLNWMDFEIWKHEDQFKTSSRNIACPQCEKGLVSISYANTDVQIDYCPSCKGAWLDKGEFEKIVEDLTNELLTKPFSGYIEASLEEAKEVIAGSESFASEWKDFTTVLKMMNYRLFVENPNLQDALIAIQNSNPIR